jgi:hypothetical protein
MTVRRVMLAALAVGALHVVGAEPPQMSRAFYRAEVIVFTRAPAPGPEQMLVTEPRSFAVPLAAFAVTERERAAIYQLTSDEDLVPFHGAPTTTVLRPRTSSTTPTPVVQPSPAERARRSLAELEQRWLEQSFKWLPTGELALKREAQQIARAAGLHLLWHGAWMQPVPDRDGETHLPMLLQVGQRIGNEYQVEGRIDVTRGRYLHFDTQLWMRDETPDSYFALSESRRLRSGELNYLDHPRLGVLVRVDPLELPPELSAELAALAKTPQ